MTVPETQLETGTENAAQVAPKHVHIEAKNPDKDTLNEMCTAIQANYDFNVTVTPIDFRFKKSVDKATGIETTRDSVVVAVPTPSIQGIIDILEGEDNKKELDLLLDAIEGVVNSAVRDILAEDPAINAETFPYDKVSWQAIANMPKAARRGSAIPKETWEAFAVDYIKTMMTEKVGKTVEQATAAADLLVNKFQKCKTNKKVLNFLVEQLALYSTFESAAEFADVLEFLTARAETLLSTEPADLLDAL
jgi:hypothetical protein